MDAVLLRYYPHNINKIYQQSFYNVKLKAGTYVYSQNDRVKKLCSTLDKTINQIKIIGTQQPDNLQQFQIVLLDPTQLQIMDMKQTMLKIGMQKLQQRINQYSNQISEIGKTLQRLDKKRKRYIRKQQKLKKEAQKNVQSSNNDKC